MTKERKVGICILAAGLLLLLIFMGAFVAHEINTLYFTIVFEDSRGLKSGNSVQISGVEIGVVKWVSLVETDRVEVRVKIHPKHTELVRQDATAIISNVSFPNVSAQKIVEIVNSGSDPPMPVMMKDEVINGMNGNLELLTWKTRGKLGKSGDKARNATNLLVDKAKSFSKNARKFSESPQFGEALKKLMDFIGVMKNKGISAVDELKEKWPRLKESLQPVMQELQQYGRDYLVNEMKQLMKNIERTLEIWKKALNGAEKKLSPSTSDTTTRGVSQLTPAYMFCNRIPVGSVAGLIHLLDSKLPSIYIQSHE
jgi:hypothetical protein